MAESKYEHIFFDLDHTLWDFDSNSANTLVELFHAFELQTKGVVSSEVFIQTYKHYNRVLWDAYNRNEIDKSYLRIGRFQKTFDQLGVVDSSLVHSFGEAYLTESPKKSLLMPYAKEVLDYLKPKYFLHIISNGFLEAQSVKMQSSGIVDYFQEVILGEVVGFRKPHRALFDHALQLTHATAEKAIYIGDELHTDVFGAREAGWNQVYFNPQKNPHQEQATYEIESLEQLKTIL